MLRYPYPPATCAMRFPTAGVNWRAMPHCCFEGTASEVGGILCRRHPSREPSEPHTMYEFR